MNELADMIVDRLLTTYIREQATWYTTSTMDELYDRFKKKPVRSTESDLLGELAKLMTKLDYHTQKEEYEICAELKKQIDSVNDELSRL